MFANDRERTHSDNAAVVKFVARDTHSPASRRFHPVSDRFRHAGQRELGAQAASEDEGWMKAGDIIEVDIDGVALLRN